MLVVVDDVFGNPVVNGLYFFVVCLAVELERGYNFVDFLLSSSSCSRVV